MSPTERCFEEGCQNPMSYQGPRWRFCWDHQKEEGALDIGLAQEPEFWRYDQVFLKFRCGCFGHFTAGCRPSIANRCAGHWYSTFSEKEVA